MSLPCSQAGRASAEPGAARRARVGWGDWVGRRRVSSQHVVHMGWLVTRMTLALSLSSSLIAEVFSAILIFEEGEGTEVKEVSSTV